MSSKKKQTNYSSWEDYQDMSGKGDRREKKKAKRHKTKTDIKEFQNGSLEDWDDLMDDLDTVEKISKGF